MLQDPDEIFQKKKIRKILPTSGILPQTYTK